MDSNIVYVKCLNEDRGIGDFFKDLYKYGTVSSRDFACTRMDEAAIRDILRAYISKNGISSLFHFSLTCDAVLHPGIHVDEIEEVILGFIKSLNGVKDLLVIDPYFYSEDPDCVSLFGRMMAEISSDLESVTFFTNGKSISKKGKMHAVLKQQLSAVKINDVITDEFHDRFWIDPDRRKGVVMGTSLNGIKKKIALIDHLSFGDVKQIAELALPLIP
ncbi:hypothetical protein HFRIS_001205 [Herbaspirillum frisingense GSF30]|uniref:Uncharacterized protein n=1 Tax=Herbaspirillum frisingense GSF30 TaxID=864073 RepID=A0AAI9IIM6_9BURK|nr:hypothetical protein [Herbaspirillum frisingense]EOA06887.1 hypothetical protein HFRIS_001205 [Herbaspirillum frisingense GSF30]